jgi:hypothetical protein
MSEELKICRECIHAYCPGRECIHAYCPGREWVCKNPQARDLVYGNHLTCDTARKPSGPCKPAGKLY